MTHSFAPILLVTGTEHALRERFVRLIQNTQLNTGWDVGVLDASKESLSAHTNLNPFFFEEPKTQLYVVENPHKGSLDLLKEHRKHPVGHSCVLLLHVKGSLDKRTKFGKWAAKNLSGVLKDFPSPKPWEKIPFAVSVVVEELASSGITIDPNLAEALVSRCGTHIGFLLFECLKIKALCSSKGLKRAEALQVRSCMASLGEESLGPVLESLGAKDVSRLSRSLVRLRKASKYDPTMMVTRTLTPQISKWYAASHVQDVNSLSKQLGAHPFHLKSSILPAALLWGPQGCIRLFEALKRSEEAVFSGSFDPWGVCVSTLLRECSLR